MYFKKALIPFIYLIFMAVCASGVLTIEDPNLIWLKVILLILNLAIYLAVVVMLLIKDGEESISVRNSNDYIRREIIETGEDKPLNLKKEYKPYKGFIVGLFVSIPLIVLLIIHTILITSIGEGYVGCGAVSALIYSVVFAFFRVNASIPITPYTYYFALLFIPVICSATGIAYIIGAKKTENQQRIIQEKHRAIYGDKK